MRLALRLPVAALALATAATAQPRPTAVVAEVLGAAGTYAVGVDRRVATVGSAHVRARVSASYVRGDAFVGARTPTAIWAVPLAAVLVVPLGDAGRSAVAVEAEYGASLAGWSGPVTRFRTAPGERLRVFPHASLALRADLWRGRAVLRGGLTMGGLRASTASIAPLVGVGVGL